MLSIWHCNLDKRIYMRGGRQLSLPIALFLSTSSLPLNLRARMVDYHNPVTVVRDFGAYAFPSGSGAHSPIYQLALFAETLVKLWHIVDGIFM